MKALLYPLYKGKEALERPTSMILTSSVYGVLTLCTLFYAIGKKKPTTTVRDAHGSGNWITAVAALPYR